MRATTNLAGSAAVWGVRTGRVALEDTRNGILDVIVPIYIAGLILPIPIGLLGDMLGTILDSWSFTIWDWHVAFYGFPELADGARYLGHVPAALAFMLVSYFYWKIIVRGVTAETAVHALPNWLQNIVAKWSVSKEGQESVLHRNFRILATIGLWAPVALWVPIELPVWRHLYHYVSGIAAMSAITMYVASSPKFETFWRKFYGGNLAWIIGRHVLGLIGIEVVAVWGYIASVDPTFLFNPRMALPAGLLVGFVGIVVLILAKE